MTHRTGILSRLKKGNRNLPASDKIRLHILAGEKITYGPEVKRDGE
jgi:hypothetical protein